ncbi:MAG: hypothetical protein ACKPKO_27780, partial [Candidatus Fonsibacter sp.]
MPVVLFRLQVIVGRGLPHILALGNIVVLLLGEVIGAHYDDCPGLHILSYYFAVLLPDPPPQVLLL